VSLRRLIPKPVRDLLRRLRDRMRRRRYRPERFWTEAGKDYMDRWPPVGRRSEELIVRVLRECGVRSLLDVGCGYGRYLRAVREAVVLDRLCGIDISPTQIEHARDYLRDFDDIELSVGPATALPFEDDSFDALHTYGLMIHLCAKDVDVFFEETRRVGRRWGFFLESSTNRDRSHLNPPHYFAHDYPAAFARHRLHVEEQFLISEERDEYLYVVSLSESVE